MKHPVLYVLDKLDRAERVLPHRNPDFVQFVRFITVGAISALVGIALLYVLTEKFGFYYLYSAAMALIVSGINGYVLNRLWTFRGATRRHVHAITRFLMLIISTYLLNLCILKTLVDAGMWYITAEVTAIIVAFGINYTGSRYWVFR